MSRIATIFWSTVGLVTFFGFGIFIWFLCRPGFSVFESILFVAGAYALVGFICYATSFPGACAIPVKWDIPRPGTLNHRRFFYDD